MCLSKFRFKSGLNEHIKTVHEGLKPFACKLCASKFGQLGNLKHQIKTVHENLRPFECKIYFF
jgi:uncharacterized Zn-finger protein